MSSAKEAARLLELLDARDAALHAHGGDYNNPVVWKAQHEYRMAREHFRVVDMCRAYLDLLSQPGEGEVKEAIKTLGRMSSAIYLATEASVANDISAKLRSTASLLERLSQNKVQP